MPNPENLKPCKPGETHNPNGRPKGSKNISTLLEKYINRELDFEDPITKQQIKKTLGSKIALQLLLKASDGDLKAIAEVMDRLEGKPIQKQEIDANVNTIEIVDFGSKNDKPDESNESLQRKPESDNGDNSQSGGLTINEDVQHSAVDNTEVCKDNG